MRRAGPQGCLRAAVAALLFCACRTAPRPPAPAAKAPRDARRPESVSPSGAPQPGSVIGEVDGTWVLALAAPQFAQLTRDQRLVAYYAAQAGARGGGIALDQSYRHNLAVVRVLRGILTRPSVVPAAQLSRIRAFARVLWLNGGLHDAETGRKEAPPFTSSDLRTAALAARAAGADLGFGSVSLEYALRALDGPLFDPRLDPVRTVHGADLTASAVNLYDAVTARDLHGLREKYALNSRLSRDDAFLVEQVLRAPASAAALEQALPWAAPPQRAVLEPLSLFLRSGEPEPFRQAQLAWLEAAGPVDFFAGFFDRSFDPRGRKAIFAAFTGVRDPERTRLLEAVGQLAPQLEAKLPSLSPQMRPAPQPAAAEALLLVGAAGTLRPLRAPAVTLPVEAALRESAGIKTALFAAADDAAARLRTDPALRLLAAPEAAPQLGPCLPQLRFAFAALREIAGRRTRRGPQRGDSAELLQGAEGALEEARADLSAHFLSSDALLTQSGLLAPACQRAWPQFAAASWLAAAAAVPRGDRVEDDRGRAVQLQLWWFTSKGALVEARDGARRFLSAPDSGRFHAAAGGLLRLLDELEASGDGARLGELFGQHASRLEPRWRDAVIDRLRAAGIPRRIAVLPPRLRAVVRDGRPADAEAVAADDLDQEVLRDWQDL